MAALFETTDVAEFVVISWANKHSSGQGEPSQAQFEETLPGWPPAKSRLDFPLQDCALQGFAFIRMGSPSELVVPRTGALVQHYLRTLVPRPRLHQRVQPKILIQASLLAAVT